jgi:hypothetical protein
MRIPLRWPIVMLVLAGTFTPAGAQSRATGADVTGLVMDQTESVLPGARVTAIELETNITRTVETDESGRFVILALKPGSYQLRAEAQGFRSHLIENLRLALGAVVDVKMTLEIAGLQEQLTIEPAPLTVDPRNTALTHVVTQPQIDALPIDRRSFIAFTIITPGVTTDRIPQPSQGSTPTSGLTFAGQRPRANNVMVDGLDNNSALVGSVRALFSQEAVHEFQVLTNSFSAEFGKASGGVINIVTKSGTNTHRGNSFFFVRDRSLNAKGHFERFDPSGRAIDQPKAPFNQKQFGAVIGGPLRKNRTFYFLSFERLDVTASNFVTIDDRTPVTHPVSGQMLGTPAQILRSAGFPFDTGNVLYSVRSSQGLARIDHQVNPSHFVNLRFNVANSVDENTEAFGGLIARSRAGALKNVDYNLALSHTWSLSDRSVNELRFQVADGDWSLHALDPACVGICDRDDEGGPTLEVVGVATVGRARNTPGQRTSVLYEVVDTFTKFVGGHQLKSGFDFTYIDYDSYHLPLNFGGRYIFGPLAAIPGVTTVAVSAIQAVAMGLPTTYVQGYGNTDGPFSYKDISLFAHDDWRLTPRLTLKLGVRYQNQLWPDVSYTVRGFPSTYSFPADNNNLAPRVGVAWDPAGNQQTSIHAAYGVFYANNPSLIVPVSQILDGQAGVRTLSLRVPQSIEAWNAPGRRLPASAVGSFPSVRFSIDPALETPYAHHVSVGIDRQLRGPLTAAANVLYVRGFKDLGTIDYNPIVPSLGAGRRPEDVGGVARTSASVLQYTSFGEGSYRGLTLSLHGRVRGRHQFLASYTLSKAEDNSTDFQSAFVVQDTGKGRDPNDPAGLPIDFNPDLEKGTSTQDQRHRFVMSGFSQLPAGFQASWLFTLASGRTFNVLAGADLNGDGDGGAFPSDRARRNPADASTSVVRNMGRLPSQAVLDARIVRRIEMWALKVDVMLEAFNLFNRTNYTEVNNVFGTGSYPDNPIPTFGLYQQAGPPRQIQVGVRVTF